jgi:isopentenyldiphosphate isomerase
MKSSLSDELFPVVDEDGNQISVAPRSICHDGKSMLLHPVVHMHLFNDKGELFLQKRALTKDLLPGYWDSSVGGHLSPGEKTEDALKRETFEELGLRDFSFEFIAKYIWESVRERELVYSFRGIADGEPQINRDEIDEGRFWKINEIKANTGKGIFTPNLEHELNMLNIIRE